MPIRRRTLRVVATVGGFPTVLGELLISKFAKVRDTWKDVTSLVCPKCGTVPKWIGVYRCEACGEEYNHHSKLKRINDFTGEEVTKTRLTKPKEKVMAQAYTMSTEEFKNYADATLSEYGAVVKDENSARNLMKLVVAVERLGQVVILKFNDTYEQRVCLLTVSPSNRVILKEIIPLNLLESEETLRVDMSRITEKDIEEAKAFLSLLPQTSEETLTVDDYRTIGLKPSERVKVEPPKVQELAEILARVKSA